MAIHACFPHAPKTFSSLDEVRTFSKERNQTVKIHMLRHLFKVTPKGSVENLGAITECDCFDLKGDEQHGKTQSKG